MNKLIVFLALFASLSSCGQSTPNQKATVSKLDCDGPDTSEECSFIYMPESVNSELNIPVEAGLTRMKITGSILKADGLRPYPGILMYIYHTDAAGEYSKEGNERGVQKWHGRHHGWLKTDKDGSYTINSIRPAQYPGNTIAAHIHAIVWEPGKKPYWINDFVFKDDPLVTERYRTNQSYPGGDGVIDLKIVNGRWEGRRNIVVPK